MDGWEWNTLLKMDDLGGKPTIFGNIQMVGVPGLDWFFLCGFGEVYTVRMVQFHPSISVRFTDGESESMASPSSGRPNPALQQRGDDGGGFWRVFFGGGGRRFEENCGFKTLSIYLLLFFSCFKPCSALFVLICLLWWVKIISIDFWNVFPCGASRFFWLLHFERRLW